MHTRILAALVVCVAASTPAIAGEIKGTGEYIEQRADKGESICRYSGLNDEVYDVGGPDYDPNASRVQSFGQLVSTFGRSVLGGGPGEACNPN
jgi:hypothetical protein